MGFLLPVMVLVAFSHVIWLTHSTCHNSISDVILKDHVIFSLSTDYLIDCWGVCEDDGRCQSLNFFIELHLCEINNRTIENRPEHAVIVPDTIYYSNPYYRGKNINWWNAKLYHWKFSLHGHKKYFFFQTKIQIITAWWHVFLLFLLYMSVVHKNCGEVLQNGGKQSGLYYIDPDGKGFFQVTNAIWWPC